jgi:hypothetical protein
MKPIMPNLSKKVLITTKHKRLKELVLIKEIRDDKQVWFKVPETCASMDINLVINELREQTSHLRESKNKSEKEIYEHFTNFIKDIENYFVDNDVKKTKD